MTARPRVLGLSRRFSPFALFRMMRGLKQSDLAVRTQIHETLMSKLERGVRTPTGDQSIALSKALRTTQRRMRLLILETQSWARGIGGRRKSGRS